MAILLSVQNLEKSYGARTLFKGLSFSIETGDRVGLIGPNGAGKSTLLKILADKEQAEGGEVVRSRGLKIGFLEQDPVFSLEQTIFDVVSDGLEGDLERVARAHEWLARLDLLAGHRTESTRASELSGGWKKRLALARELVREPDILILDEPTNHLDLESILWLEDLLSSARFATLTVTHDRMFLERVANRIFDLDGRYPDGLLVHKGSYSDFLEVREGVIAAQARREEVGRNTLRRETEWLRRGAKARTTKQTARIQRAHDLKEEVEDLTTRNLSRTAAIDFQARERHPQRLIEAIGLSHSFGENRLFESTDILVTPKSRIGLLGPNGAGKTTLIRLLLGEEVAENGQVKRAEKLQVAYYAQHRDSFHPDISVLRTICPDGDYVNHRGQYVFARSYLNRFLFRPEQMDMPIAKLSGGEKARLRIAQLMLEEANVLVLDEPTNDLDMATLGVLEASLVDFEGAVILVTHDRYFLDQVANELLAFVRGEDGLTRIERFADSLQWEAWLREQAKSQPKAQKHESKAPVSESASTSSGGKRRMSYKDKRELEGMEERILAAEERLELLKSEIVRPEVASDAGRLMELTKSLAEAEAEVERLYARWAELSQP